MCLPPTSTWTRKGQSHQHRVRTRWGSKGRINLVGTLSLEGEGEFLEYSLLEGSCRSAQVISYLDAQASQAERAGEEVVVVLDNAPFHTAASGARARGGLGRDGAFSVPASGVLPAPQPHRGGMAKGQGFPHAAPLLRLGGRVERGRPGRSASTGREGDSYSTWRYLTVRGILSPKKSRRGPIVGPSRTPLVLLLSLIHRSAWKVHSPKFGH